MAVRLRAEYAWHQASIGEFVDATDIRGEYECRSANPQ